MGFEKPSPV